MPKAGKKLKRRSMSVQRVDDVHCHDERSIFLHLRCLEGWLVLAISADDLNHIAGFSARQFKRKAIDAGSKGSHMHAVE
jgi:hypothetical protein